MIVVFALMNDEWIYGFVKLADNIYAYIDPDGTWFKNNTGVIIGERYNIIIDSQANGDRIMNILRYIKSISDKPIKLLINTHHHGDHIWTNHIIEDAIVISHVKCWEETFKQKDIDPNIYSTLFPNLSFREAKYTPQDIVFKEELSIKVDSDLTLYLKYLGPAHTVSDIIIYIPDHKIVFAGDILFYKVTPLALDGYVTGWIDALNYLLKMDDEIFIPGHGPITDKKGIRKVKEYFKYIMDNAEKLFKMGYDFYEAAKKIDLGEYAYWKDWERIVPNIERIYMELKGEEPAKPIPDVFSTAYKMFEYKKLFESD